jgi:hypothetical protein
MVEPADAQLELPFDEFVRELDPSLPRDRIWESAHECAEANLTIASGALTDSILAENKAADERELQVLAAHAGQVQPPPFLRAARFTRRMILRSAPLTVNASSISGSLIRILSSRLCENTTSGRRCENCSPTSKAQIRTKPS